MKNKDRWISIIIVAMSLATAWAIRGQFGHEQGAAWAGAIGGLALVMVSDRKDWYNKMLMIALVSGIGWGAGGMISYGRVVGYGRADNFINAFYGLSMLFVIGALFGLLGGGLLGLVLESTKERRVNWGSLMAEMVAGGIIGYYFLIEQIGLKMTPPRSEAWAIIFGAGLAMLWYMARNNKSSAIRVALFSALGSGYGFAFGNFLQIMGNVMEIHFNMWNVMEYSIGFFGGAGMAYGIFSSEWPADDTIPSKWANRSALFILIILIPLIIYKESLSYEILLNRLGSIANVNTFAWLGTIVSAIVLLIMLLFLLRKLNDMHFTQSDIKWFFFIYIVVYTIISYIVSGIFAGRLELNHHLYLVNIILIFFLAKNKRTSQFEKLETHINPKKLVLLFLMILVIIALLTLVAINSHDVLSGSHNRFPVN